ncbi:MAG: hypothetical protein AAFN94_09480 [Pseudomonadota bacterium]
MSLLAHTQINLGALLQAQGGSASANPADVLNRATTVGSVIHALQTFLPNIVISDVVIEGRAHTTVRASSQDRITFTGGAVDAGDTTRSFGSKELVSTALANPMSPDTRDLRVKPGQ